MKTLLISLLWILGISQVFGQFFVQKMAQNQITGTQEAYVVLINGDTLRGRINSINFREDLIRRVTLKHNDQKLKLGIGQILAIGVIPPDRAKYDDAALFPVLRSMKNKAFIEVLPDDGYVIYERIRLPGRQERYEMAQLLNPGFDSKLKVYAHPETEDNGYTKISGLAVEGLKDNLHYISVGGEPVMELRDFQYRKRAFQQLYGECEIFKGEKLKWKHFPEHVFAHFQECK